MQGRGLRRVADWLSLQWARLRYPLGAFVGWLAAILSIVSGAAIIVLAMTENTTVREVVLSSTLAGVTVLSLGALVYREVCNVKPNRLASTVGLQAEASTLLRDLRNFLRANALKSRNKESIDDTILTHARQRIERILSLYSECFSMAIGTRCRTCVKLIGVDRDGNGASPDDFYVFSLARDTTSARENRKHDKRREEERLDKLADNSDFLKLWDQESDDRGYFYSKDLRDEKEYESSSLNYWKNIEGNPNVAVSNPWPIWYISTIVWPIRQEKNPELGINEYTTLGFFAVDARRRGSFDEELHGAVGTVFANAMFPVLELYRELSGVVASDARMEEACQRPRASAQATTRSQTLGE